MFIQGQTCKRRIKTVIIITRLKVCEFRAAFVDISRFNFDNMDCGSMLVLKGKPGEFQLRYQLRSCARPDERRLAQWQLQPRPHESVVIGLPPRRAPLRTYF